MGAPSSSSSARSWYQECGVGGQRSGAALRMAAAASVAARTVSATLLQERWLHLHQPLSLISTVALVVAILPEQEV